MLQQFRSTAALALFSLAGASIGCSGNSFFKPQAEQSDPPAQVHKFPDGGMLMTIPTSDGSVVQRELEKLVAENPKMAIASIVRTGPDIYQSSDGAGFVVALEAVKLPRNYKIEFVETSERDALASRIQNLRYKFSDHRIEHMIRTGPAQSHSWDGAGFVIVLASKASEEPDNK